MPPSTRTLIRGGRIVDPASGLDQVGDLLIDGQHIAEVGKVGPRAAADLRVIEAAGLLVTPGLIDMHAHFREPGKAEEETILSGARAAAAGGITSVACFPNTEPAIDNEAAAEFVVLQGKRAGFANVFPVGAVTANREGQRLAEMGGLARAGAVAFSDADHAVESAEILRRGLLYAKMFGKVVVSHPEDRSLRGAGVMNQGVVSLRLGLAGIPAAAEEVLVARDLILAQATGARIHIGQMSTAGSVELLRMAKAKGILATGEVTPHHLALTDVHVAGYDANFKMLPPLRGDADREALVAGLKDGTIDCIATGHAPHSSEEKEVEFANAPFGVIGVETMFPVVHGELVLKHRLPLIQVIEKMTINPARILGLSERGALSPGMIADITVWDLATPRVIDSRRFQSRSRNCPFHGMEVRGTPLHVLVGGRVVMSGGALVEP
jgi:dihydroorotase